MSDKRPLDLFLSVGVVTEIWDGIGRLPEGRRRLALETWLTQNLLPAFEGRVEGVDAELAEVWGLYSARLKSVGRNDTAVDALIGATAALRGHVLVTRNVRDFEALGIRIDDPWSSGGTQTR